MRNMPEMKLITVPTEVEGDYLYILDKCGHRISNKRFHMERFSNVGIEQITVIQWQISVRNFLKSINSSHSRYTKTTTWQKKAESLASSYIYRTRDVTLPKTRRQFEKYPQKHGQRLDGVWRTRPETIFFTTVIPDGCAGQEPQQKIKTEGVKHVMAKNIKASEILEMIQKQNYRCALTGRELTPETASLDHIYPLSKGGIHNISNIWVVHHEANTAKGTLTAKEFIQLCQEVTHYNKIVPGRFLPREKNN